MSLWPAWQEIPAKFQKLPQWVWCNRIAKSDLEKVKDQTWEESKKNPVEDASLEDANLITSEAAPGKHYVMLDLDMDAQLIPSSTPGHHHLYIDKLLPWDKYKALLTALADAGIIGPGYAEASIEKGFTALRFPTVKKTINAKNSEDGWLDLGHLASGGFVTTSKIDAETVNLISGGSISAGPFTLTGDANKISDHDSGIALDLDASWKDKAKNIFDKLKGGKK